MSVIKNLFHVSLQENDYEKALDFYCNKLGFEQMFELNTGQFKDMLKLGEHNEGDGVQWLTYLRIAPEEYLELFNGAINPPDFKWEAIPFHKDTPFESFGLGCDDLERTVEELKRKGIDVTEGCMTDPGGAKIRLVERKGHQSKKQRLFNSLAGVSLYVNDLEKMEKHLVSMCLEAVEKSENAIRLSAGESGQYVELIKAPAQVKTYDDDLLGHIALQIYKVTNTVKAWGKNGVYCCPQPFMKEIRVPADDTAEGNFGLDRCEIIWMICPEGNKVEVMVQPGNTMQQEWERENPY
ncbi:MAG: VOC family protein [Lachnospiraceae bacterium]